MILDKPRGIYIHLPFCKTKCPYCDFASFAKEDDKRQVYIDALVREIDARMQKWAFEPGTIETIFFGGGTPSVHSKAELAQVLDKVKQHFSLADSVEITLEANPGTIDRSKLEQFLELGVNRISFGAQSFDAALLDKLGRGHSVQDSINFIEVLTELFPDSLNSWSFDLIYGLPGQTIESWLSTVETALSYKPPHISAYCLSIEKNTPYGKIYKDSSHATLPQEEDLVTMYERANELFATAGLQRYEISNWAKPGHEARHNLIYWRAQEYYAFGLSAHGYVDSYRYHNTRDLDEYINASTVASNGGIKVAAIQVESVKIDNEEKLEEKIMLQMRLAEGLDLDQQIQAYINVDNLEKMKKAGFISGDKNIKLTDKAQMLSNRIIAELCYH
ncbi:MAG: radical SAM family heme chaperone HemW [Cyanobacteria bacterium]|nr:radical SAM family heme chaperone HemW [Cyanobacteriota bacterium]MDA1020044.1 radical SAM family heme chaperone HemW [Cyanobacteriota bacterium]